MGSEVVEPFDIFWESYPLKQGKKQAKKAWEKIKPNDELLEKIIKAVEKHKKMNKKWADGYTPHPATFLNQERWEDEVSGVPPLHPYANQMKGNTFSAWERMGFADQNAYLNHHTPPRDEFLLNVRANPTKYIGAGKLMGPYLKHLPLELRAAIKTAINQGLDDEKLNPLSCETARQQSNG